MMGVGRYHRGVRTARRHLADAQLPDAISLADHAARGVLADRPDAWPYAFVVSPRAFALALSGSSLPVPPAPWQQRDGLWVRSRASSFPIDSAPEIPWSIASRDRPVSRSCLVAVGVSARSLVLLDLTRIPSVVAITGSNRAAFSLICAIAAQLSARMNGVDDIEVLITSGVHPRYNGPVLDHVLQSLEGREQAGTAVKSTVLVCGALDADSADRIAELTTRVSGLRVVTAGPYQNPHWSMALSPSGAIQFEETDLHADTAPIERAVAEALRRRPRTGPTPVAPLAAEPVLSAVAAPANPGSAPEPEPAPANSLPALALAPALARSFPADETARPPAPSGPAAAPVSPGQPSWAGPALRPPLSEPFRDEQSRDEELARRLTPAQPAAVPPPGPLLLNDIAPITGAGIEAPIPFARSDLSLAGAGELDLRTFGHLLVLGVAGFWRSQILRTLAGSAARTCPPTELHIYGVDGDDELSGLQHLSHCGAVVPMTDRERLDELFRRLDEEQEARRELWSRPIPGATSPARILIMVNDWEALVTALEGALLEHTSARLMRLLEEGPRVGIHLIIAARLEPVQLGSVQTSDQTVVLRINSAEPTEIIDDETVNHARRDGVSGRLQVALLGPEPSVAAQTRALHEVGASTSAQDGTGHGPIAITGLPTSVPFVEAFSRLPPPSASAVVGLLGLSGPEFSPALIEFTTLKRSFLVIGPRRSGRSNTLATLGVSLLAAGARIIVITPQPSPLQKLVAHPRVHLVSGPQPDLAVLARRLRCGDEPTVVLWDDVDARGNDRATSALVDEALTSEHLLGMVAAGSAEAFRTATGTWMDHARGGSFGVLLAPQNADDGELLSLRFPPTMRAFAITPGRGYLPGSNKDGGIRTIVVPRTELL